MPGPEEDDRIPEPVAPLPLPDFEYDDLEKEERVGTGGDADVYRATIKHNSYTYPVAVKEPRFEGTIQQRVVEKFQTEAETWNSLNDHDNIVSVYTWGVEPLPWLGLEFMDGGTLNEQIGSLDVVEALWLSGRIAEGIRYGHRHGVAHLDIKPTNVLLRDTPDGKWKYPKVSDWGLAKMLLEHSNSIEGISPTYAAPEQFDAEEYGSPDDITDIYQLGALVYALVAGEPPFTGSSTAVMQGVLQEDPEPPSAVNSAVPAAVDEVVLKSLAKEKDDRYEGVLPFKKKLDQLFVEYSGGDVEKITSRATSPADDPTEKTNERRTDKRNDTPELDRSNTADAEGQTQSSLENKRGGSPSSHSSTRQRADEDSSPVSRRAALGLVGVGILGGGGWMATQSGGNNDDSAGSTVPTETPTEEPTDTETPNDGIQVIDSFESGLSKWSVSDNGNMVDIVDGVAKFGSKSLNMSFNESGQTGIGLQTSFGTLNSGDVLSIWYKSGSLNDRGFSVKFGESSDRYVATYQSWRNRFGIKYVSSDGGDFLTHTSAQASENEWFKITINIGDGLTAGLFNENRQLAEIESNFDSINDPPIGFGVYDGAYSEDTNVYADYVTIE